MTDPGPQRGPATMRQIGAQAKQVSREIAAITHRKKSAAKVSANLADVPRIPDDLLRITTEGRQPSDAEELILAEHIAVACAAIRERNAEASRDADARRRPRV